MFDFREGHIGIYGLLVEEGNIGEPMRISHPLSGQVKKNGGGNRFGSW